MSVNLPSKKFYRQRAHSNPISDHCIEYPVKPENVPWEDYFPISQNFSPSNVKFADIGCGYGGLLIKLADTYPDILTLGLEIRVKVSEYTKKRISALQQIDKIKYANIACIRTNAMKYLPNYFKKAQLEKLFFLFPDPHFKSSKHKWRIINSNLLAEYAYVLTEMGQVYTVTDVKSLHEWTVQHFEEHPLFQQIPEDELKEDPIINIILNCSEEGKKVTRNNGEKYFAVFQRIPDPYYEITE